MGTSAASGGFGIGEVAAQTGVAEGTLRMWERRHGFPAPRRLPGGRRSYSARDVDRVRRVAAERAAGTALAVAIERALRSPDAPAQSVYASLRRRRPDLESRTLRKPLLAALSQAIEDECLARADRPLLFGSFQRERYYRRAQARWRELARGAEVALVFADFAAVAPGAPVEVPVARDHPMAREWAVVCEAPGHAVCLAGWEPPGSATGPATERAFETVWSVEPAVVREAASACSQVAAAAAPDWAGRLRDRLEPSPAVPTGEQLRLATAITTRALAYVGARTAPADR